MAQRIDNATKFGDKKGFGVNDTSGAIEPVQDAGTALGTAAVAASAFRFSDVLAKLLTLQSDAGIRGRFQILEEEVTLSTSGLTTDSTANLLPAASLILGLYAKVTTTITTTTSWAVGDASTADRFTDANSTLIAGTASGSANIFNQAKAVAYSPYQAAAAKVRITGAGSNPGAGKIRLTVFAFTMSDVG